MKTTVALQVTNVKALCSMNADNKTCIQVYDESLPIYMCIPMIVITCPLHCLDLASDFKRKLGCCFGTLIRTPTSFSHQLASGNDLGLQSVPPLRTNPRIVAHLSAARSNEQRMKVSTTSILLPDQ